MTFTYDGTLDTDVEKVRFEVGDTDAATAEFTDEEIEYKIGEAGSVLLTAAALCEVLATRYARRVDFSADGQSVKLSQRAAAYAQRAAALRQRAESAMGTVVATKVDGYSSDLDAHEGAAGSTYLGTD